MKNINVISIENASNLLNERQTDYSVIFIYDRDKFDEKRECTFVKDSRKTDIINIPVDEIGYELRIWQADRIIRFCERNFDIDNIYVVHENRYNIAVNLAYEISLCYDLESDINIEDIPENEYISREIRTKYTQISNSLIHILSPMDYCKKMLEIMFEQLKQALNGELFFGYSPVDFFWYRQCTIYLKKGIELHFHLETNADNLYFPDMDDIEYINFYGVPEIADPSSFEGNDNSFFFNEYFDESRYGIYNYYEKDFCYNSIGGITRGSKIPEKYENYRTIQREYTEFYREGVNSYAYIYPEMKNAFRGMVRAEKFLAEKNGYIPKFCQLPRRFPDEDAEFITQEYVDHIEQIFDMMREHDIWNGDEYETVCAYAAYFYTGHLRHCGHCENMTLLKYFFEKYFCDFGRISEFEKLWNIDKYVPSLDTDPLNRLCLAIYALIETVKPYNGCIIPKGTFPKCLDFIYSLTEGRTELNNAVIMAGTFAGIYCNTLD